MTDLQPSELNSGSSQAAMAFGEDSKTHTPWPEMFVEITVPEQKPVGGALFPAIVGPRPCLAPDLSTVEHTVADPSSKAWLESLLRTSGAVLLRGFPITNASEFNRLVEAFGYQDFPYMGAALRTKIGGRVYTANESPLEEKIYFHQEMALLEEYPSKCFFYCEVEPASGGETPIVLSRRVYEKMREKHPGFVDELERHGLLYKGKLKSGDDPSSPVGRGWQSSFQTSDRRVAEERAAQMGIRLEWEEEGDVATIIGPKRGIIVDETRGHKTWFNSLQYYAESNNRSKIMLGDGTALPSQVLEDCGKIMEEESVAFSWKKGDVLLLDNVAVLHSRRPCKPPRRVLASFCK